MTGLTLASAVRGVPAPPCIGCPQRLRCATEQLLCLDFARYVNLQSWRGRTDRNASRARYARIFRSED